MADVRAIAPAEVKVRFPRSDDGVVGSGTYDVTVPLTALSLPEYAGRPGFAGTQVLHASTIAPFLEGTFDGNPAVLETLARQLATDFYHYRLADVAAVWAGAAPWELEGLSDWVEWTYRRGEVSLRVEPPAWNQPAMDLGFAGEAAAPVPGGTLTVEEVTAEGAGASYPAITVLQFDTDDGYLLSQPAPGIARLDLEFPSTVLQPIIFGDSITIQGGLFIEGPVVLTPFDWRPGPGPVLSNETLPAKSKLKLFAEGDLELTGFAGGTNGRFLWIENRKDSPGTLILKNEDARSDPINQIVTPSAGPLLGPVDFKIPPRCTVGLEYNGIDQRWYVVHVPDREGSGIGPGPAPVAFNLTVSETDPEGVSFDQISTIFVDSDDGFSLQQNQANAVRIRFTPPAISPFDLTVGSDGTELTGITRIIFAEMDSLRIEDAGPGEVLVRADDFLPAGPTAKHGLVPAPPTTVPTKAQFLRHDARFAELQAGDLPANGGGGEGTNGFPVVNASDASLTSYFPAGSDSGQLNAGAPLNFDFNTLHSVPFMAGSSKGLTEIRVSVNTPQAAARCRVAVYEALSKDLVYPGALKWESGEVPLDVAGYVSIPASVTFVAGKLYWITYNCFSGSGVGATLMSCQPQWAPFGYAFNAPGGGYFAMVGVGKSGVPLGPFPATYPSLASGAVLLIASSQLPYFLLRF